MTEKPDSVMKHEKFQDLMKRYHGQIENALYAAEQVCTVPNRPNDWVLKFDCDCPFNEKFGIGSRVWGRCSLQRIRDDIGDNIKQHDIQIPDDNTPSERKMRR